MLTEDSNVHCNSLRRAKGSSLDWHRVSNAGYIPGYWMLCARSHDSIRVGVANIHCSTNLLALLGFKRIVSCHFRDKHMCLKTRTYGMCVGISIILKTRDAFSRLRNRL